jgi:monovalent cation/hydrogen antiporter
MPQPADDLDTDPHVIDRLRREYEKHLRVLRAAEPSVDDEPALRYDQQYTELRLAVLRRTDASMHRDQRVHEICRW